MKNGLGMEVRSNKHVMRSDVETNQNKVEIADVSKLISKMVGITKCLQ